MNQVHGISTKQICLSLSNVAVSCQRALLVDALGSKTLSSISPLTALRWVSSRGQRWCRKLCLLYKIWENENPKCLFSLFPNRRSLCSTRNIHNTPFVNIKDNFFKNFFPSNIIEWNNLDPHLRKCDNYLVFKNNFLSSYDHLQTLFIITTTLGEFVLL